MNLVICGILSLTMLAVSVVAAILLRHDLRRAIRALSIGFFITIFLAIAPCNIEDGKYSFGVNLFETICVMITQSSLHGSLEAVSQYNSSLVDIYRVYIICLYVIGPISVAGATLSFFKGFSRLTYTIKALFSESYVFSSANERSMAVCRSIHKQKPKALILFALGSGTQPDEDILSQIDELGGIVVQQNAKEVKHSLRHKRYYYLLDRNATNNIEQGLAVNEKYKKDKKAFEKVDLLIYSTDEMSQLIFYNTTHHVTIRLFREEEIIANDLLFNHPLYEGIVDGKLNVLLVGCGKIGYEILKKIMWAGYFGPRVKTQVNVIAANASSVLSLFRKECPALFEKENFNLALYNASIQDDTCTLVLSKIDRPTYIVVALGDERTNVEACIYLRRYYGITNGYPLLHMTTDTEESAKKLDLLTVYDWDVGADRVFLKREETEQKFEIKGFGSYDSAYRLLDPTESAFGMLALVCHYAKMNTKWDGVTDYLNPDETVAQFIASLSYSYSQIAFCKYNADQLALSVGYLLYVLGYHKKHTAYLEKIREELGLRSVCGIPFALYVDPNYDFLADLKAHINEISALTTERFNRFMYTLGWQNLPVSEIKNKSVRDQLRLRYARIGDYDVDELETLMSEGEESRKNYRQNDIDELLKLPAILKAYIEIMRGIKNN